MPDARRRRLDRVFEALNARYGAPVWKPDGPAMDELVLTVLSQHTNDRNRDAAYARLRQSFRDWGAVARAPHAAVAQAIRATGLSNGKARSIQGILRRVQEERGDYSLEFLKGRPPEEARAYLRSLPGVGPKTAACVLLFCFGMPLFPVDTHIHRVTTRLGILASGRTAEQAHEDLAALIPPERYYPFHLMLIRHGRDTCHARRPACGECALRRLCPSRA